MNADPEDVCWCGDYRRQHRDGTGPCELNWDHRYSQCVKFRLFRKSKEEKANDDPQQ